MIELTINIIMTIMTSDDYWFSHQRCPIIAIIATIYACMSIIERLDMDSVRQRTRWPQQDRRYCHSHAIIHAIIERFIRAFFFHLHLRWIWILFTYVFFSGEFLINCCFFHRLCWRSEIWQKWLFCDVVSLSYTLWSMSHDVAVRAIRDSRPINQTMPTKSMMSHRQSSNTLREKCVRNSMITSVTPFN